MRTFSRVFYSLPVSSVPCSPTHYNLAILPCSAFTAMRPIKPHLSHWLIVLNEKDNYVYTGISTAQRYCQ